MRFIIYAKPFQGKFEEEYTLWICSAAKDIAFTLNQLKPDEIKSIISRSEEYQEKPESVFVTEGLEPAKNLCPLH